MYVCTHYENVASVLIILHAIYSQHGPLFLCVRDNMLEGLSGNPNHMANCFPNLTGSNIAINGIRFWLGDYTPPPDTLNIRLWSGSTITGPDSNIPIYDESITGYDTGMNTFTLQTTTPITIIAGDEFCAGVYSGPVDDGFRISTEIGDGSVSYRIYPTCDVDYFTSFPDPAVPKSDQTFCIEALFEYVSAS